MFFILVLGMSFLVMMFHGLMGPRGHVLLLPLGVFMLCSCFILCVLSYDTEYLGLWINSNRVSNLMLALLCLVVLFSISLTDLKSMGLKLKSLALLGLICSFLFTVDSLLGFFMSFEASMIPIMYLVLGHGHQPERISSSFYILMYTMISSVPLILTILFLTSEKGMSSFLHLSFSSGPLSGLLVFAMVMSFLVKLPLYGFHIWLPMAHVEAPLEGSVALAGIMLKLGGFGLYRFWGILSWEACKWGGFILMSASFLGMIFSAVMSLTSTDVKAIVAYSSVSHMNFMLLSFIVGKDFSLKSMGITSLSHAISSSLLFFLVTSLYSVSHSRNILLSKGVFSALPSFQLSSFVAWSMNLSAPPFFSFLGELTSIFSVVHWNLSILLGLGCYVVLSSLYSMNAFGISSLPESKLGGVSLGEVIKLNSMIFFFFLSIMFFIFPSVWDVSL
uniref:NADH-ubiquinone oxidoreductase chain 4 n=1 Tax=Bovicola bovis TaxID=160097 RepID=A0A386B287_9NEOP|nr:NADH dehydrogenase subunit 4 [Bovicola bovis]